MAVAYGGRTPLEMIPYPKNDDVQAAFRTLYEVVYNKNARSVVRLCVCCLVPHPLHSFQIYTILYLSNDLQHVFYLLPCIYKYGVSRRIQELDNSNCRPSVSHSASHLLS